MLFLLKDFPSFQDNFHAGNIVYISSIVNHRNLLRQYWRKQREWRNCRNYERLLLLSQLIFSSFGGKNTNERNGWFHMRFSYRLLSHGGESFFQTTWADFVFAATLENLEHMFGRADFDKYPALQTLKKRIHRIPAISDWLMRRPITTG